MSEERDALRNIVFPAFARELKKIPGVEDFRIGVDDACPYPATFHTRGLGGECGFESGKTWMTGGSTKLESEFACVGNTWSGDAQCTGSNDDEQPASGTAACAEPNANPGFLRDDAVLIDIALTDEDEKYTPGPGTYDSSKDWTAQKIFDRLVATKGGNPKRMVFLGIGGKTKCTGVYGTAIEAIKLKAVTDLFKQNSRGVFWDLCVGHLEDGLAEAINVVKQACNELARTGGKGAACSSNGQCLSGACTNGVCEGSASTDAGGFSEGGTGQNLPPGSVCATGGQCASANCTDGTCVGVPNGGLPGGTVCEGGAQCGSGSCTNGVCEGSAGGTGLPGGSACVSHGQCASGTCDSGTCTTPGGSAGGLPGGAACVADSQCSTGQCTHDFCELGTGGGNMPSGTACSSGATCASGTCSGGHCAPGSGLPGGSGCASAGECASGECTGGVCEGGSSGGNLPAGSACTGNAQCESFVCLAGKCENVLN
jgi:hypothetical protein